MNNLKGLDKAQQMFDDGKKMAAIKYLRQQNSSLDLTDARCALDSEFMTKVTNRKRNAWLTCLLPALTSTLTQTKVFISHVKEHGYDMYGQALANNLLKKISVELNDISIIEKEL